MTESKDVKIIKNEETETGIDRIKKIYDFDNSDYEMERDSCIRMTRTAFLCGFFIGGMSTAKTAHERFEKYSVGKKFLNRRDALRRKMDYGILMFAKNGFRMGFRAAALAGSVMVMTTHMTVYRNKYSPIYFPAFSGLSAFIMHRACGIFAFPLGIYGQLQALGLGTVTGTTLSAVSWLYALSVDKNFNDAYIQFREEYTKDMSERLSEEKRVRQLMKDENIRFKVAAYRRLHELDKQKLLQEAEKHDS